MKRMFAPPFSIFLLAALMGACASAPISTGPKLEIKTGGGVTGPFFALHLSPSGILSVQKESLPFDEAEGGLTTVRIEVQISPQETSELLALASSADDFSEGCGIVGHGTSARMWLTQHGRTVEFSCDNAAKWPVGAHTLELFSALNRHLPERLHVF